MPCLFPCILWFSLVEGKHGGKHNFQLLLQSSDNEYPLEGGFGSISKILLVPCFVPCLMVEFCVYCRLVTMWEADDCPPTKEELLWSTLGLLWNQTMDFQLFCFHEKLCILKCMHYCANCMPLDISAQITQKEIAEDSEREREDDCLTLSLSATTLLFNKVFFDCQVQKFHVILSEMVDVLVVDTTTFWFWSSISESRYKSCGFKELSCCSWLNQELQHNACHANC